MSRILLDSTQGELEFLIFKESIYRLQKEVREMVVDASTNGSNLVITIETGDSNIVPITSAHAVEITCCRANLTYCVSTGVVQFLLDTFYAYNPKIGSY